ncbi:MAG: FecR family protein [Planctomycetota bacterium]|jgi:hypothetical protein
MFDPEKIITLYFFGDEALTQADVDRLSEWIGQSQENAVEFIRASCMHRAIHDALVGADIKKNILLDLDETINGDYEGVMDSNVSLRGVNVDSFTVGKKQSDGDECPMTDMMRELLEMERTAPAIEIPKVEPPRELIQKVVYPPRRKREISKFNLFVLATSAAAMLFLAIMVTFAPSKPEVVARFTELEDCRWMDSTAQVLSGDSIHMGQRIELASGSVQVEFDSGARMTIMGPTILEPLSNNSAFITQGHVHLVAETPGSKGYTLQTPNSTFVDIGTAFTAKVTPDGLDHVNVTEGEVDVVLAGVTSPTRLRVGEAMYIEPGQRRVITRIEPGDGTPEFRFRNIAPPSSADYADQSFGRASIRVVQGVIKDYADVNPLETMLLDGMGQSRQDDPKRSAFFDDLGGSFLVDLGQAISITKINTYSWHQHETLETRRKRAAQQYTLYGYSGDQLPDTSHPARDGVWERIARVNTDSFFDVKNAFDQNRPAQQACSITAAQGEIGRFRYLLWVVEGGTFYGEFDVFGSPDQTGEQ